MGPDPGPPVGGGSTTDTSSALTRLSLVARALAGVDDAEELMAIVVNQGVAGLDANAGVIAAVRPDGILDVVASVGLTDGQLEALQPVTVNDDVPLAEAVRRGAARWATGGPDSSSASLPLIVEGRVVGVLGLYFPADATFSSDDRSFLAGLADISALALGPSALVPQASGTPAQPAVPTLRSPRQVLLAYVLAVTVPLIVVAVLSMIDEPIQVFPSVWLLLGVIGVTVIGGARAAVLAVVLSGLVLWWGYLPPDDSFDLAEASELMGIAGFCLAAGSIAWFVERLDRSRLAAERAEAALRESEARLDHLVALGSVGVMRGYGDLITEANDAFLALVGRTRADLFDQRLRRSDLTPPEERDLDRQIHAQLQREGVTPQLERALLHRDGRRVPVMIAAVTVPGRGDRWLAFVTDLSERHAAEARIRASEERYRSLVEATTSVVWSLDSDTRAVDPQPSWQSYTGQRRDQYEGRGWLSAIHPDDRPVIVAEWDRVRREGGLLEIRGRLWSVEHRSYRHCVTRAAPVCQPDGTIREWVSTSTDVHDIRLAEQAAARSTALLESLLRTAPVGFGFLDEELRFVLLNEQLAEINGLPVEAHVGRRVTEIVPDLAKQNEALLARVIDSGAAVLDVEVEGETAAQPGVKRTWLVNYYPVSTDQAETLGIGVTVVEITERKRLEQVTREAEKARATARLAAQLEAAQHIARLGSWEWDPESGLEWSAELLEILAFEPGTTPSFDEIRGRVHPDDTATFDEFVEAATGGRLDESTIEVRAVLPGGEQRIMRLIGEARHAAGTPLPALLGTVQDVTEQRRSELALRRTREELFRTELQRERERRAVEAMQQAVLPGELPRLDETELAATYAPAGRHIEVGGDWYDAFTLGGETVVITVGDVAGHGLEAAAMMGQLRNALRAYAAGGRGPGEILGSLNELLHQLRSDRYATAVVALYEPSTGHCRWSHAGHPPPLRFSKDGVSFLPDRDVGGPLLGAVPTATYPEAALHLDHGEGLLLYTDGLIERRGASIDDGLALLATGLRRFSGLAAEEICTELVATVFADRPRQDDICQLIVRRSG